MLCSLSLVKSIANMDMLTVIEELYTYRKLIQCTDIYVFPNLYFPYL